MLLLILGSLIVRGEEEEEGTDADGVRQDRSSGNLSRSGRVKLWDRKDRAGGKNCAVEGDREIAVVKSLLPHSATLLLHSKE